MASQIELSVVVPIYKNENTLIKLNNRLIDHLKNFRFEIIYVNDASPDDSLNILKKLSSDNQNVKYIDLSANIRQQKATLEGLKKASGTKIVVLDGDLQDKPELINTLYMIHNTENEAVFVLRKGTYQSFGRMLTSVLAKKIVQFLSGLNYKAGSYYMIDHLTLSKVLNMATQCPYPYMSIIVVHCAKNIKYLSAKRDKSADSSGYNFIQRIRVTYQAIYCCLYCRYVKLKHF